MSSKRAVEVTFAQATEGGYADAKKLKTLFGQLSSSDRNRASNLKAIGMVSAALTIMIGVHAQLVKCYEEKETSETTTDVQEREVEEVEPAFVSNEEDGGQVCFLWSRHQ